MVFNLIGGGLMNKKNFLLYTVVINSMAATVLAQDTNYWTQQFGTRSNLLGGTVIGSVSDMSATYYNPGAIALFEDASFLLSAKVYEYSTLKLEGGAEEGKALTSSSITPTPDLLAGSLTFKWLGKHKLSYSLLTRQRFETDLRSVRKAGTGNVIPSAPGDETYAGELLFSTSMKDLWAGLTWSHSLGKNAGIGITNYLAIRDQDKRTQFLAEALTTTNEIATSVFINQYEYENYRLLWKAGIGFNLAPLTFGLTVTTPSLNLFGSGSALANSAINGFDLNLDGTTDNFLVGSYQEEISSRFNSSWAVGVGGSYRFGKTRLHFSAEWFDAVDKFTVLDTKDLVALTTDDTIAFALTHELDQILNYGIGIEQSFGERTTGFASFATDFSGVVSGTETNLAITNWDIHHFAVGAAFTVGRWELTLGAAYAFGSEVIERSFNLPEVDDDSPLVERFRGSEVFYRRIKLLFGFSFEL
jgi:hypothetical protein